MSWERLQDPSRGLALRKRDAADALRRRALTQQRRQELLDSYPTLKQEMTEREGGLIRLDFQHRVGTSALAAEQCPLDGKICMCDCTKRLVLMLHYRIDQRMLAPGCRGYLLLALLSAHLQHRQADCSEPFAGLITNRPAVHLQIAKWCHENRDPETGALPDVPTEEAGGSRVFLEPPRAIPMAPLVKGGKGAAAKGKPAAPAKKAAGKGAAGKGGKCFMHVYSCFVIPASKQMRKACTA